MLQLMAFLIGTCQMEVKSVKFIKISMLQVECKQRATGLQVSITMQMHIIMILQMVHQTV